ncbi:unnamed protein product [Caenorhabditis auriculariae]|uniref:EGF-like domain-containing protein n=1 Tax=Caenorhabditis auriculariae TaxID=2777116 RepID=A0A8S1GQ86_9PELO|nr:unnamed protein product [Caenorhabditis auriculariae]
MLKYGQPCDRYKDRCNNGAKCIDAVCKCSAGFALSPTGWCESFDLAAAISNNKRPFSSLPNPMNGNTAQNQLPQVPIIVEPVTRGPYIIPKEFPTPSNNLPENQFPTPNAESMAANTPSPKKVVPLTSKKTVRPPKALALGGKCDINDICLNGGECKRGVCICPDNTIRQNGYCIGRNHKHRVVQTGDSCEGGEVCSGGAICDSDSKKCICAAQHVAVHGICRLKNAPTYAAPGEPCRNGDRCSGGSTCEQGLCTCDLNHFAQDGYCRPIEAQHSEIQFSNGTGLRFSSKAVIERPRATACDEARCRLPSCFCTSTGRKAPGNLPPHETPQFIVLSFDDAVNGKTFPDYKALFEQVLYRNPNGCPIKGSFFISHEWTNYDAVEWLVQKNQEIASNSISHVSLEGEPASRWLNEMDGQRRILSKFASAPEESILGMRAPQLALGGDEQFEMMSRAGFLYDNSMSANPGINGEPFWPQTLDYTVAWPCYEDSCPKSSFTGVWEVPLNQFYGAYMRQIDSYRRSSMIRAAVDLNNTVEELTAMMISNFDRSYSSNRAPYVLSLNADFLQLNGRNSGMKALRNFLGEAMANQDVYVVTFKQLIDWMKEPVPISQMSKSEAVRCPTTFSQNPSLRATCEKPNKCMYNTPALGSSEHQFLTCSPCPALYPWLENPVGSPIY